MSFVGSGRTETFLNSTIKNDGFFPDLKLGDFQLVYRVPGEYKQELIEEHLRIAMGDCNLMLAEKVQEWVLNGAVTLADTTDVFVGGKNVKVMQYERAVFCRAMALLVRAFATLNRRTEAENLAKEGESTKDDYFTQANRAIRRLLGQPENITAELL